MAKWVHDDVLDGAWNIIKNNATQMSVCSAQPATRADAITNYMLAIVSATSTDFTAADGDTSGRKVTVGAKSGVSVTNSGTATHVAIVDGTRLLYVTTCTSQALTASNTVNVPTWKAEIADPT